MTKKVSQTKQFQLPSIRWGRGKQKLHSKGETGSPGKGTGHPAHNTRPSRRKSEIMLGFLRQQDTSAAEGSPLSSLHRTRESQITPMGKLSIGWF